MFSNSTRPPFAAPVFQAYHSMLEQSPHRRLVIFHQFCLSGGVVEFMRRPSDLAALAWDGLHGILEGLV